MKLINRPCTLIRRTSLGATDIYGNDVPSEETVETVCELQQRSRAEVAAEGEFSKGEWALFLRPDEELDTSDAVLIEGRVYEVTGEPWVVRNPRTGQGSHIEATVARAGESETS